MLTESRNCFMELGLALPGSGEGTAGLKVSDVIGVFHVMAPMARAIAIK